MLFLHAWNLLSPGAGANQGLGAHAGTPSIVLPQDSGKFEIHVRLKNFGQVTDSGRIEGRIVEHAQAATCGPPWEQPGLDISRLKVKVAHNNRSDYDDNIAHYI